MLAKLAILTSVLVATPALASPQARGAKATDLARALKFAGVKPELSKKARTFKVAKLSCWTSREGEDEDLGDYKCTLDKLEIKDGLAALLQGALESAGVPARDHMSQHTIDASVTCTIDPAQTADLRFTCSWQPVTEDVKITPKKLSPKDIVQPVKIEKQEKQ